MILNVSQKQSIRLVGIDTPQKSRKKGEPGQPYSQRAVCCHSGFDIGQAGVHRILRLRSIWPRPWLGFAGSDQCESANGKEWISKMDTNEFKKKIASIYEIANELGREFNISKCTPDGHLMGAIGKIAAKIAFGLGFGSNLTGHNCTFSWKDGISNIQVACTGRGAIAIRHEPIYLIALEITESGKIYLLFNGPGKFVWEKVKNQKQPQKYASKNQLKEAQAEVDINSQIPIKDNLFDS